MILTSSVLSTFWIVCLWTNQCHLPCVETSAVNIIGYTIHRARTTWLSVKDLMCVICVMTEAMKTSARKRIVAYYALHLATWMYCLKGCHSSTVALKLVNLFIYWLIAGMATRAKVGDWGLRENINSLGYQYSENCQWMGIEVTQVMQGRFRTIDGPTVFEDRYWGWQD